MGNLRFILVITLVCVVLESALAQNRGSVRYGSTDYYTEEVPPQRQAAPTRGPPVRRRRPTSPPEQPEIESNPAPYQSHDAPTGSRVSSRPNTQRYAPPTSYHPIEEAPPPPVVEELPVEEAPKNSEDKGRRRRPKKRRRPQNSAAKVISEMDGEKVDRSKVVVDNRPQAFNRDTETRSNPNAYGSSPSLPDKPVWSNSKFDEGSEFENSNNPDSPPHYFPPQTGSNRLPAEDSETEEAPSRRYIPPTTPKDESYVPVLPPVRGHSEPPSSLPIEEYSENKKDTTRNMDYDRNRGTANKDRRLSEDVNNARAPQPTNRLPNAPEVRYETPYSPYMNDNSDSEEHLHDPTPHRRQESTRHSSSDNIRPYTNIIAQEPPQNRNTDDSDRRSQARYEPPLTRAGSRYGTEEAEVLKKSRTATQDERSESPSRSRDSTRSRSESSQTTRSRTQNAPSSDKPESTSIRTRGGSRYQPESSIDASTSSRGSSGYTPDSSIDTPTRTRESSQYQPNRFSDEPSRSRSTSRSKPAFSANDAPSRSSQYPSQQLPSNRDTVERYQPEIDSPSRQSSQAQPVISEDYNQYVPEETYRGRDSAPQKESAAVTYEAPEDMYPVRNTLRSRPQFAGRDGEPPYAYEELEENFQGPQSYSNDNEDTVQPDLKNQRVSPVREQGNRHITRNEGRQQSPEHQPNARQQQPEYKPTSRQQSPPSRHGTRQQPRPEPVSPPRERSQPRQPLPRPQRPEAAPTPPRSRSPSSNKFECPDAYGFFADSVQCDRYYECRNYTVIDSLCEDGLAFNEASAPRYLRCDSLRDVDCSSRPELQEARPSGNCPRRYGLYPSEKDCTKFFNCVDGTSTQVQCPPGLTFNDERATCDWADLVKSSCKTEDLLGFSCPEPSAYDLQDGVYTSYPHPDNCQLHFVCIKGSDGERRPRMLACNEGLVYSGNSGSCTLPKDVPGCEDFYESLNPAPKRKAPALEPEDEAPRTKPRRGQNRSRN